MSERATYHHGDLAEALRVESARLVREHGVHGFSLRAAARGVGVDVAAAYRHYGDKAALLRAVARDGFVALGAEMASSSAAAGDAEGALRAVGRAYVRFALAEPELFRLMFGPFGVGGAQPVFEDGSSVAFEVLTDTLTALAAAGGCVRPIAEASLAAWSGVHGFATLVVDGPLRGGDVDAVLSVVIAGLRAG